MGNRTIYQAQSQDLLTLFEDAGHPSKIMCVALDYAKATHTALLCNGAGEYLRKPFPVYNSQEGINFLIDHDIFLNDIPVQMTAIDMAGTVDITVPAGLPDGHYNITLKSPDGQSVTLPQAFKVEGLD